MPSVPLHMPTHQRLNPSSQPCALGLGSVVPAPLLFHLIPALPTWWSAGLLHRALQPHKGALRVVVLNFSPPVLSECPPVRPCCLLRQLVLIKLSEDPHCWSGLVLGPFLAWPRGWSRWLQAQLRPQLPGRLVLSVLLLPPAAAPFPSPLLGALPSDCIQRPTSSQHLTAAACPGPCPCTCVPLPVPALSIPTSAPLGSIPKTASRALPKGRGQSISLVFSELPGGSPSLRKSHIFSIIICFYSLNWSLHAVPFLPLSPP